MRYVLYHKNCYDGLGAAYAAWKKFGDVDTVYIPVGYGSEPPAMEPNSEIYILDMSYSPKTINQMYAVHNSITILDHHKSAMEQWTSKDYNLPEWTQEHSDERSGKKLRVIFRMNKSGAGLTWDYFHGPTSSLDDSRRPEFIDMIEDRDLWKFKKQNTKAFHSFLLSIPQDFRAYANLEGQAALQEAISQGRALERMTNQIVENICKNAYKLDNFFGHKVVVVNTSSHWSEVGNRLLELHPDVEFACSYTDLPDNTRMFSLRSKAPFDVSQVASKMGGGGHAQAAGFKAKLQIPFSDVVYTSIQHK